MERVENDTIVAQATAVGEGAIGIIRLSGPQSRAILEKVFVGKTKPADFESHRMYLGYLFSPLPGGERVGVRVATGSPAPLSPPLEGRGEKIIDKAMVVWMKAPNSFSGEEMVEIHAHGSPFLLCRMIETLVSEGARLAEPGEFSKRAFLNGKIDLSQAEAVADIIAAKNEYAAQNALDQLGGFLSKTISRLKERLIFLLSRIELGFDFSEEDVSLFNRAEGLEILSDVESEIQLLLDSFQTGQLYKEGLKIAIVGSPNVGKSSLLNALINEEKAIIHETPGTTRDVLEGERKIKGILATFYDTAGIRDSDDPIEKEGMRRSRAILEKADLLLHLIDSSRPMNEADRALLTETLNKRCIIIYSKSDLPPVSELSPLTLPSPSTGEGKGEGEKSPCIKVSSLRGWGISELIEKIYDLTIAHNLKRDQNYVLNNVRHKQVLDKVIFKIKEVKSDLAKNILTEECLSEELRIIIKDLSEITGIIDNEQVLDEIFSKFCIGK